MPGHIEILIICGVVILLFGASAIPKLARSIGKAKKEFQKGFKEGSEEQGDQDTDDTVPESKEDSTS